MNSTIQLKVDLREIHKERFEEIKRKLGFQNNTELVRYLIYTVWSNEIQHDITYIELPKILYDEINYLLERRDVKQKLLISTVSEFVTLSIKEKIQDLRNNLPNLLHWDVRMNLSEKEREISIGFVRLYEKSNTGQVTVSEVVEFMKLRNKGYVEGVLDSFVERGLLKSDEESGEKFYFIDSRFKN